MLFTALNTYLNKQIEPQDIKDLRALINNQLLGYIVFFFITKQSHLLYFNI